MKNIFLIPTDKPSYLVIDTIEDKLYYQPILHKKTVNVLPHFIYITNDEQGRKNDWVIHTPSNKIIKVEESVRRADFRKIIMTNDLTLIEDGVQEVSSEFLSFYAENPVDYVKVEKWLDDEGERFYSFGFPPKKETEKDIIMELQKDPLLKEFDDKVNENLSALKNRKETEELQLNQAFEQFMHSNYSGSQITKGFVLGAMKYGYMLGKTTNYTEEEVKEMLFHRETHYMKTAHHLHINEWFEQFKK